MKRLILMLLAALLAASVYAQSADRVTEILDAGQAKYGQMGYLAATMLNLVGDDADDAKALEALADNGYVPQPAATEAGAEAGADAKAAFDTLAEEPVTIADAAQLCAKVWDMGGSIWYAASHSRRYALKLLKSHGLISSSADPAKKMSGKDVLNLFTACIERYSPEGEE